MTEHPHPVGDPIRAFRTTLQRAYKAEAKVRELRARIAELEQREGDQ